AVLYEGYLLYPYRQSALKNQQRWNFGVLYPARWAANQTGADRSYFQMECLATCREGTEIEASLRFLQLVSRDSGGSIWQEAIEQRVRVDSVSPAKLASSHIENFSFPGGYEAEGAVIRRKCSIEGKIMIFATQVQDHVFRLTVRVSNTAPIQPENRDEALLYSLASAHAVVHLRDGVFVSQIDAPEKFRDIVAACQNVGIWPVLVGDSEMRDTMLASPIILYDYPQVAPESKGDLFDATEIDEILSLRILTLTDEEKQQLRQSDDRARNLLERLETSPPEHLLELHGTIRRLERHRDAWSAWDTYERAPEITASRGIVALKKGDRVCLRPRKRADIFDTLLEGKTAIIEAVEEDFEGNIHFAVVLEDDPGRDFGEMRQAGHRFFFSKEEVEPFEPIRSEGIE
ncbi:MAG: hypothetical protein JO033_25195, partial [Acidobacteriaceae bacterium]|nr:hypothetical protein [Acidobacteriaceae bacterium]